MNSGRTCTRTSWSKQKQTREKEKSQNNYAHEHDSGMVLHNTSHVLMRRVNNKTASRITYGSGNVSPRETKSEQKQPRDELGHEMKKLVKL